jgi:hypothetical protein
MIDLRRILDWKTFERMCTDLLQSRGFRIQNEPSVDTSGNDIVATCDYFAHDKNFKPVQIRWHIQCKHYVMSGKNLGRDDLANILVNFQASRNHGDALLIITSSDYTEPAMRLVEKFNREGPAPGVEIWNGRQVAAYLDQDPDLARRYDLLTPTVVAAHAPVEQLSLSNNPHGPILLISDQSALAHDLCSMLQVAGLAVVFLPVWNYNNAMSLTRFLTSHAKTEFSLVALFLGDTFGTVFPFKLEEFVFRHCERGGSLLLFPFVAWSVAQGALTRLARLVPVRLSSNPNSSASSARNRSLTALFKDRLFMELPSEFAFEEDEYREYDPKDLRHEGDTWAGSRFGISHTFEHLDLRANAEISWKDTQDNPFLVRSIVNGSKVVYFNTCCHSCLEPEISRAVQSPLVHSPEFRKLAISVLKWLLQPSEITAQKN